jgi:hypothetical protein
MDDGQNGLPQEKMEVCLGKTETTDLVARPEDTEPAAVHEEVPKEDGAVKSFGVLKKRHEDGI